MWKPPIGSTIYMAGMWLKRGWYGGGCRQDKDWVRILRDGALTAQTAQLNKHSLSLDVTAVFRIFVSLCLHTATLELF